MPRISSTEGTATHPPHVDDILAIGFGTTVAMWGIAYVCRFPPAWVPSHILLILMLACMLCEGFVAGRYTLRGWRGGLYTGVLTAVLNMLILGSLLGGNSAGRVVPSALLWLPGSLLAGALFGVLGSVVGSRFRPGALDAALQTPKGPASTTDEPGRSVASEHPGSPRPPRTTLKSEDRRPSGWTFALSCVSAFAALLLLTAGGLVTSKEAGLAVVDWPNSFGYNMFLYPLSRMTGGIFYEHAHRLLGSLVGMAAIVLTIQLCRSDPRRRVRILAILLVLMIVCQGVMGGLRVTGHLTLSTSRESMAPSIVLAVAHGVLGQVVLGTLAALCVLLSPTWLSPVSPRPSRSVATDRTLTTLLPCLLAIQLTFGALLRHMYLALHVHITFAVIVTLVATACGLRAVALYDHPIIRRTGITLLALTAGQSLLGILALVTTGLTALVKPPPTPEVTLATVHQVMGAILLCCTVILLLWHRRLCSRTITT